MSQPVAINGSGVAACCCAHLLQTGGLKVSANPSLRGEGPVLMLSEQTQKLLCDVFGNNSIFESVTRIHRRIVLWQKDSEVTVLPHSGIVVEESALLAKLWSLVALQADTANQGNSLPWRLISGSKTETSRTHHFGTRVATASKILFKSNAPQDASWIESLDRGWLFLLPCGNGSGSLISVGDLPSTLLGQSRLISDQIDQIEDSERKFPAYPRANTPLCDEGWISCGTAALGFDPICGEGAGNAVREAILASAVILGSSRGLNAGELLTLYSSRLMNGFARHLRLCLDFYRSASRSDWWESETGYLEQGLSWSQQLPTAVEQKKYRLAGFELQQVS